MITILLAILGFVLMGPVGLIVFPVAYLILSFVVSHLLLMAAAAHDAKRRRR